MRILALLLGLLCLYMTVVAARDALSWCDRRWRWHKSEIVSTAVIAIVLLWAGIVFIRAGING